MTAGQPEDRAETARREAEIRASEQRRPPDPRGGYVHRPSRDEQRHTCPLPAEWEPGAVWRCPEGHLWVVYDYRLPPDYAGHRPRSVSWEPATWWQRRRWGGKRARGDMANGNRRPGPPKAPRAAGTMPGVPPAALAPPSVPGVPPKDFDG